MADLKDLIAYIEEGNEQAVRAYELGEAEALRWAGKSHAYLDVLAFIENELEPASMHEGTTDDEH